MTSKADHLRLAKEQLARVQRAWDPPDWPDLSMYGFYCLENAVVAAFLHARLMRPNSHPSKLNAAATLHSAHGLPDVVDLLKDLNELRKSEAYGDIPTPPELDAEDVAIELEAYVQAVEAFLGR